LHTRHNHSQHSIDVSEHIIVPESKYLETLAPQISLALAVVRSARCVLPTVRFYDESSSYANEIGDVWTYRYLTPKLVTEQSSIAQSMPE
jgi:hypothetical protein